MKLFNLGLAYFLYKSFNDMKSELEEVRQIKTEVSTIRDEVTKSNTDAQQFVSKATESLKTSVTNSVNTSVNMALYGDDPSKDEYYLKRYGMTRIQWIDHLGDAK